MGLRFVLMGVLIFCSCSIKKDTKEEGASPPASQRKVHPEAGTQSCRPWLEFHSIRWNKSVTKINPASKNSSLFISVSKERLEAFAQMTLEESDWPTLVGNYKICESQRVTVEHTTWEETLGMSPTKSGPYLKTSASLTLSPAKSRFEYPLSPSFLGLRALSEPAHWYHSLKITLDTQNKASLNRLAITTVTQEIPYIANFSYTASSASGGGVAMVKELSPNQISEVFHMEARQRGLFKKEGIGFLSLNLARETSSPPACRISAQGDLYYIRPRQKLTYQRTLNSIKRFKFLLNVRSMGEMAVLATPQTLFKLDCKIGSEIHVLAKFKIRWKS